MADNQDKAPEAAAENEIDDVRARAVAAAEEAEAMTPTPTQAELDQVKLGQQHKAGAYKTRQAKAG